MWCDKCESNNVEWNEAYGWYKCGQCGTGYNLTEINEENND